MENTSLNGGMGDAPDIDLKNSQENEYENYNLSPDIQSAFQGKDLKDSIIHKKGRNKMVISA